VFIEIKPSKVAKTMRLRLECFSISGCTADKGLVFGPRDSNGRTIRFEGATATSEPLTTSSGAVVGTCTMYPADYGDIGCKSSSNSIKVPYHGWVGTAERITYTVFTAAKAGEPLANDHWVDSSSGVNPGNKTDNDSQLILTPPKVNPIWVYLNPTLDGIAAGQGTQDEELGFICSTEALCPVKAGASFKAVLSRAGVYFPSVSGQTRILSGDDIDYSCKFARVGGYKGPGTNVAVCRVAAATIIDHYGESILDLPIKAIAHAYPEKAAYHLTLLPAHGTTGNYRFTTLAICAPLRITSSLKLPKGKVGAEYKVALRATGGVPTSHGLGSATLYHDWLQIKGSLPHGLTLTKGVISGTPTKAGSYVVRLMVTDEAHDYVFSRFTITVSA
jgi:hypothetical protein